MTSKPVSRRRQRKKILRHRDGSLYDASERRRITRAELRDHLLDGGLFEARRQETGADCTYEVLQAIAGPGLFDPLGSGAGGGTSAGLKALGTLGLLGGLGGDGTPLARLLEGGDRPRDGWPEDWDEPASGSRRRTRGSAPPAPEFDH